MTARTYAVSDSLTMLRRNLRRATRYPVGPVSIIGIPVIFLLLFVYVFGDTLGAGLGGFSADRAEYVNYVTPGIILIAIAGSTQGTAISVAMDMKEGIISRFRTMAISRVSVLNGHVLGNLIQTMLGLTVVVGVALLVGFRPTAGPVEWLSTVGLLALVALALTWLSVTFGLVAKTVEGASNLPLPLMLLPFLGSGFVPTEGMPAGLAWFAEYQPFTPHHGDDPRLPPGDDDRQQRCHRRRLVRGNARRQQSLGEETVQPRPRRLARPRYRTRRSADT